MSSYVPGALGSRPMTVLGPVRGEGLYATAKDAAGALNVSIATLYAYVSRGLIRSQGVPGSRNRRYWRVDIERLKGKRIPDDQREAAAGSGEETRGLDHETKITLLTAR